MSQSLDLLRDITYLYFWYKTQVLLYIKMKSASHTSIITALKFTCCSSLSLLSTKLFYTLQVCYKMTTLYLRSSHPFPSWGMLQTVHNHLQTRIPMHLSNRIQLLLSLVQMFLRYETHLSLLAPCTAIVQWKDRPRNRDGCVRTCC